MPVFKKKNPLPLTVENWTKWAASWVILNSDKNLSSLNSTHESLYLSISVYTSLPQCLQNQQALKARLKPNQIDSFVPY